MSWTDDELLEIWNKGAEYSTGDPADWRLDECGALMRRQHYGDRNSPEGWEVDRIAPDGGDSLDNLRPLQWQNHAATGDGPIVCVVKAVPFVNKRLINKPIS